MKPRTVLREAGSLRLHPVAERLLARPDAGRLFPAMPGAGLVRVLPDGTVVAGAGAVLKARRERRTRLSVEVVCEAAGEDTAVLDLMAVGELVAGASNPLALGAAYGELRRHWQAQGRPRKGYRVMRYHRQHGMKPHERIEELLKTALGYSRDQLAKFEKVLRLPPELREAFAAGGVALRLLLDLADRPTAEIEAVAAEIRAGAAAAEAIDARTETEKPVSAARTWVKRLLRALADADAGLAGRCREVTYLDDGERAGFETGRRLLDELLAMPTRGEALAVVLGTYAPGRTAG